MRARSPALLIDLLDIHAGGITTAAGLVFEIFEVHGPDPWFAPQAQLDQIEECLCGGVDEIVDETTLQVIVCGHDEARFFTAYEAQPFDTRSPLSDLRARRYEFLKAKGLHGVQILVAVGLRQTKSRLGKGARASKRERLLKDNTAAAGVVRELLERAGMRVSTLSESRIRRVFALGVVPQRLDRDPPLRCSRPPLTQREQLLDADLPESLHTRGDVFAARPHAFEIMGMHHAVLTMTSMPERPGFADAAAVAFHELGTHQFRASFCIYFPPRETAERHNNRGRRIQNARAHTGGHVTNDKEISKMGHSEALSWELANTNARLVHVCTQIALWHESPEYLARLREFIKGNLRRVGYTFVDATHQHDIEIFKTLPGGAANPTHPHQWVQTTSSAALSALPLFSLPKGDPPVLSFENRIGGPFGFHPMAANRLNNHGCVLGTTGVGKSFCVNALIAGMLGIDGQVVVIDHAGEDKSGYRLFVELLDERARFISILSDEGRSHLDPLPHRRWVCHSDGRLKSKALERIDAVLDLLLQNTGGSKTEALYRAELRPAISAVYAQSDHPSLRDLVDALTARETTMAQTLAILLGAVVEGPHGDLFASSDAAPPTELDLVVFDLFGIKSLPAEIREAVIYLASHIASDVAFVSGDSRPSFVIFDEAGELASHDALGHRVGELFSTARKHYCGVWAVTQAWSVFKAKAPVAADQITNNASTQILFNHGSSKNAHQALAEAWGLSLDEQAWMKSLTTVKGEYSQMLMRTRLMADDGGDETHNSVLTFAPSAFEKVLFSSDPKDRVRLQQRRAQGGELIDALNDLAHPGVPS